MQKFANDFFFFIFFLSLVLIFNCWNWKPNKNNERALVLSHSGLFFVCRIKRSRRPSWKSRKACKKKPSDLRPILTTPITSFSDRTRTRLHPPRHPWHVVWFRSISLLFITYWALWSVKTEKNLNISSPPPPPPITPPSLSLSSFSLTLHYRARTRLAD